MVSHELYMDYLRENNRLSLPTRTIVFQATERHSEMGVFFDLNRIIYCNQYDFRSVVSKPVLDLEEDKEKVMSL